MDSSILPVNASAATMQDCLPQRNVWKVKKCISNQKKFYKYFNNLQIFFLNIAMCSKIVFSLSKNIKIKKKGPFRISGRGRRAFTIFLWKQVFLACCNLQNKRKRARLRWAVLSLISFPTLNRLLSTAQARGWGWTKPTKVWHFLWCHTRLGTKFWRHQVWDACFLNQTTHVTINRKRFIEISPSIYAGQISVSVTCLPRAKYLRF